MTRALINTTTGVLFMFLLLPTIAQAHPPWGIAVDQQGRIYFSALETIWKIDAAGRLTIFRAGVSGRHTHELNMDAGGNLYGEDLTYEPSTRRWISALWKMTPAGDFSYLLAPTDNPPKGISIWGDGRGNAYAVQRDTPAHEMLLTKRTPDGQIAALSGSKAALEKKRQTILYNLGGAAFGTDGAFYFTDHRSVYKLGADGAVKVLARDVADAQLLGLTVDARGEVYAADIGGRRVLKIAADAGASTVLESDPGWMPTGVAYSGGSLYVLEFKATPSASATLSPRVRKLSAEGKATVLATVGESVSIAEPETLSGEKVAAVAPSGQKLSYTLIGTGALLLGLACIAWGRAHRRGA
jgi:hypothetical protein